MVEVNGAGEATVVRRPVVGATWFKPARHPATAGMLRWFEYEHLPPHLQDVSRLFHALAHGIADRLPDGAELTTALRKLLEAKDCAVRAAVDG